MSLGVSMPPGGPGGGVSPRRVVLVTGLSGAGKASILHVLEDLGYEAMDNPPLPLMEEMVLRGDRAAAIGVDARSRGFDPHAILAMVARLKSNPALRSELVFAWADEEALLRRYTETRRRHPLAPTSRVADGIAAEIALTAPLREAADLVLDTSDLPLPMLRRMIEQRFAAGADAPAGMTVSLMSFAYPAGLPREAELVFDARFLRNPHYVPTLRELTGLDPDVAAYVEADPDFWPFVDKLTDLLLLLLPRFIQEGKKYACVAIGCTGGRHRSVRVAQLLADRLLAVQPEPGQTGGAEVWRVAVTHRELLRGPMAQGQMTQGQMTQGQMTQGQMTQGQIPAGRLSGPISGPGARSAKPEPGTGGLRDTP